MSLLSGNSTSSESVPGNQLVSSYSIDSLSEEEDDNQLGGKLEINCLPQNTFPSKMYGAQY